MAATVADVSYAELREEIELILSEGKLQSRQATEWEKVQTYWQVGNALYVRVMRGQERAVHGDRVFANLSKDLNLGLTLLYQVVKFRRALPSLYARTNLSWTHYRSIITLPTLEQRTYYERAANRGRWTVAELQTEIGADNYANAKNREFAVDEGEDPFDGRPLRKRQGQLYTYTIRKSEFHPDPEAPPVVDLGFGIRFRWDLLSARSAKRDANPTPGSIVTVTRDGTPIASRYRFRKNRERRLKLYTYVARPTRTVDGDTVDIVADCGFGIESPQRLRLRGIDTPELYFRSGERARDFTEAALASVDFCIITTRKVDKYGRYLADLTYLPGEPDPQVVLDRGIFLNRQLLEERLAVRYPS